MRIQCCCQIVVKAIKAWVHLHFEPMVRGQKHDEAILLLESFSGQQPSFRWDDRLLLPVRLVRSCSPLDTTSVCPVCVHNTYFHNHILKNEVLNKNCFVFVVYFQWARRCRCQFIKIE